MGVLRTCPSGVRSPGSRHLFFRPVLQVALLVGALVVALGACSDGDSTDEAGPDPSSSSPATDPTAEEFATDAQLVDAPAIGTCWRMPPAKAADKDYWFDDSPQVPCTERHTLETVAVYPLASPAPELALEHEAACDQEGRLFIGINRKTWVPWRPLLFLPSQDQIADGALWVRCDVAFAAQTSGIRPAWFTGSAEEVGLRHPEEVWGCLDRPFPRPTPPRFFVPCDKPHAYEATGHLLILEDLDSYPTPRELRIEGKDCQVALRNADYEGLAVRVLWRPPADTEDTLLGSCWVHRPDGQDLPPLQ